MHIILSNENHSSDRDTVIEVLQSLPASFVEPGAVFFNDTKV